MSKNKKQKYSFKGLTVNGEHTHIFSTSPEITLKIIEDVKVTSHYEKEGIKSIFKGKIGEYVVIGELLKTTHDVYLPIIDVRGIDCIVKLLSGKYVEVQVKTRSSARLEIKASEEAENRFIVCYIPRETDAYWVLPLKIFKINSIKMKNGKYRLFLGKKKQKELEQYKNNLSILYSDNV